MKLVLATPLYPPEIGGPATYAETISAALPGAGIDVEVVKFSDVRKWPKIIRHYVYQKMIERAAKDADIVMALDPVSTGLPAMRAARNKKKKFVVKIVGDYAWEQGTQRFGVTDDLDTFVKRSQDNYIVRHFQKVERRVAKAAVRVIVPSEYLKGIVTAWGIPAEKIEVIYNAVLIEQLGKVPEIAEALPRPRIVAAGRLVPWKNIEGVIDAVAMLRMRNMPAALVVAGDGPEREKLEAYATAKLGGAFAFVGTLSHPDVLATLKFGDVFAINSTYEGLSHMLIEAAILGVPAVATAAGGNGEVLGASALVPPGDAGQLAYRISDALAHPDHYRPTAIERFAPVTMITRTRDLLASL